MKNRIRRCFAILMVLSGMGIAAYPIISNEIARRNASQAIAEYTGTVEAMSEEELDEAKEAAMSYNRQLSRVVDRDESGEAADTGISYVDMLGLGDSIGYISIPRIDVKLPIYEGTGDDVLSEGVGHMEQSSFPLGGESTHCALTGHRGMPNAVLFTDLDELEVGDCFYLYVLNETLAYQVDRIKVVEPDETGDLDIVEGEDYCTLVTCTPYAVNTHRLLVRGVRTEYTGEEEPALTYQELRPGTIARRLVDVWPWLLVSGIGIVGGEGLLLVILLRRRKKRREDE